VIINEVVNEAISYILTHIGEPLTVNEVAVHCHFSKFYFERIFKEQIGESVYAFIKRIKMEQSAFRLKVEQDKSITDICCEYGYSSSNYSAAFKQHHKVSPVVFRRHIFEKSVQSRHNFWQNEGMPASVMELPTYEECDKRITIAYLPDFFVLYERHLGNYHDLREAWAAFLHKYHTYMTEATVLLECTFDDPSITNADGCLYDICMTVPQSCPLANTHTLPGGKFAVYHFTGYVWEIYPVHQTLLNIWFPQSHLEIDCRYGFDRYHYVDSETMYMDVDFCIPVK